jgi:medium-chain acyl-[acyl-carrier-protein] hydrolase
LRPSGNPQDRWLAYRDVNPRAKMRMFCFPYAGGGASIYRGWGASLPSDLEVCPVQIPGRESRLREPPFSEPGRMIPAIADALDPYWDLPFVFFGHSMGAMISFELTRELRRRGRTQPLHLFVSGRRAPQMPAREEPIHALPEPEFIEKLRELNGTPEEVLQHAELMKLILPILRADFGINETYEYTEEAPLDAGISAFGGLGDEDVTREDVEAWKENTRSKFRMRMLPGDHFFINSGKDLVLESVSRDLAELSAASAPRAW